MKKVAIIQNRFQRGGRMQVLVHIISILNEIGIVPDLLTFRSRLDSSTLEKSYGLDIEFNVKEVFVDLRLPFEWHILFFNKVIGRYLDKYQLVINSNNTSFGLPGYLNVLSYVHFPRKERNISKKKNIHFPEGAKRSLWDIRIDPFLIASAIYRTNNCISLNDKQVANSDYTRQMIIKNYRIKSDAVDVVYPPVDISFPLSVPKKKGSVISLGRYAPDKRQLEQIELASHLPEFHFNMVGFVNEPRYFNQCKQAVAHKKLNNVSLMPDLSLEESKRELSASEYFLHSLRNEPFGITTVQAIAAGCIPLVHDSGGQKEIVPDKSLRYTNMDDAIKKLKFLNTLNEEQKKELQTALQKHILQFDIASFKNKIKPMLIDKLNRI